MGKSRILIIGATSYIGLHVANASLAQHHPTFILVRDPNPSNPDTKELLDSFTSKGATLLEGSIVDCGSLVDALKQVDVVISTVGPPQIADQINIINAIKQVKTIKRFLPSEFGNDVDKNHAVEPMKSIFNSKIEIRREIEKEAIPHTYVISNCCAGYFLSNFAQLGLTAPPRDKILIYGDGDNKAVYMKEEDIGTFTIMAVDDHKTLNKKLYMMPDKNTFSTNDLVDLWEKMIKNPLEPKKPLDSTFLSEEEVLDLIPDVAFPENYMVCLYHTIYVKGDQTNFKIGSDGVEATKLYPDVDYTTVEDYLKPFV